MAEEAFADFVKRAIERKLGVVELLSAYEHLQHMGEGALALELYRVWLAHNSSDPLAYAIHFNLGTALSDAGSLEEARDQFRLSLEKNSKFLSARINLGGVLERLGRVQEAVDTWSAAADELESVTAEAISNKTAALKQIGRVFETSRIEARAEEILRRSLEINSHQRDVIQHWIALRQVQCKWPLLEGFPGRHRSQAMHAISPLSLAVLTDDPIFQLASSNHYNKHEIKRAAGPEHSNILSRRGGAGPLRVGYVSSDFREHAVGFLMAEVFELHDAEAVETYAYYCGIATNDQTKQRFMASAKHWRDINAMSDDEAAQKIADDGIDILVDLNGYTKDARLNLIALRPAPIIVNWLGFPGTMASPYHNYIIADNFVIPDGYEGYFSEKVVRLPCYQPNDRRRLVSDAPISRREAGLPEEGVVFCCFNGSQKITEPVFKAWMDILNATPGSTLWLLGATDETNDRLKSLAGRYDIGSDRLVFAPRMPNPDHIARFALADLFLDTFPYGAHTTASDSLWMGVPVVTMAGKSFASRVCGSLVTSAGLSSLVCSSLEEYIRLSSSLANDPGHLARLKAELARKRATCTLFDSPGLVRSLETLYRGMWAEYASGTLHQPDLSNLELLHEIGCEIDHEQHGRTPASDYQSMYKKACIERGARLAAATDPRLSEQNAHTASSCNGSLSIVKTRSNLHAREAGNTFARQASS